MSNLLSAEESAPQSATAAATTVSAAPAASAPAPAPATAAPAPAPAPAPAAPAPAAPAPAPAPAPAAPAPAPAPAPATAAPAPAPATPTHATAASKLRALPRAERTVQGSWSRIPALIPRYFFVWNDPVSLVLLSGLPIFFFSIFGLGQEYSSVDLGRGNVAAQVMVNMALYGMVFMVAAVTARVGSDIGTGWLRQVALTPVSLAAYNFARITSGVIVAALIGVVLYIYGFATGVKMEPVAIWQSYLILIGAVAIGGLLGLAIGLIIRSDTALGIVGGLSSLIAFLSGIFIPIEAMGSFFQTIAPFMPLWGAGKLLEGSLTGWSEAVAAPIANVGVTLAVLLACIGLVMRRSTRR